MTSKATLLSAAIASAILASVTHAETQTQQASGLAPLAAAQSGGDRFGEVVPAGVLTGRVIDADRGDFLNGAIIRVREANRSARTDREGRFVITGLAAGTYQVEVDFLGFDRQTVEAQVSPTVGSRLEIALSASGVTDRVYVGALRDQQTRELNQQRAADNIINVISADSIGRFPDRNIAEALQRVSGVAIERDQGEGRYISVRGTPVQFNAVSVNGVILPSPDAGTRAVDLDTIPTDVVSSIEITKALLPSMDADSIGGNINIITQGALDSDEPILRFAAGAGRNELGGGTNQRYSATLGNQFNDGQVGLLVSASYNKTERETDNFENDFTSNNGEIFPEEVEFKDYEVMRERYAVDARLDFRTSDNVHLYLTGLHSRFIDDEFRHSLLLEYDDWAPGSTPVTGVATDVTVVKELRNRRVENTINAVTFGGDVFLDRLTMDFTLAYTQAKQDYPVRNYLEYELGFEPDIAYDFSRPNSPVWTAPGLPPNQLNFNPDDYEFVKYQARARNSKDDEYSVATNFSLPLNFGNAAGDFRFGAKYRGKEKKNVEDRKETEINALGLTLADVTRGDISQNFDIQLGQRFLNDFFSRFGPDYEAQPDFVSIPRRAFTSDFTAEQDIFAAYGMAVLDWGVSRIIAGARVEYTDVQGDAFRFNRQTDEVVPTSAGNSYTNFFPNLQYRREVGDDGVLRLAYTTALNRPEIEDLVPAIQERDRGPGRREVSLGNPDLDAAYAHNLDVMFDYFIRPVGVISVGAFYKHIDDVIFEVTGLRPFEGQEWEVTQPENGGSGYVMCIELNWQQVFANLPDPFDGLGAFATFTFVDSEADLPRGLGKVRLPGQSDQIYNLGVFYEKAGFSARLAYNWRSKFVDSVSLAGREFDVYWDERGQLDFTTSYQLTDTFQIYGEASNLTDSRQNRFSGSEDRVYEREGFGRFWQVGLRASF